MNEYEGRPQPYVGVSGVVKRRHVEPSGIEWHEWQHAFLQADAQRAGLFETDRQLALGVKTMHKTQWQDRVDSKGREWHPVGEQEFANSINPGLLTSDTMTVAQAYLDVNHVQNSEYRKQFARRIAKRGEKWLQAVQFDMLPWHQSDDMFTFIDKLKENHDLKVLLQVHGNAMGELGPKGVAQKLGTHAASFDYLLFDASHGTGKRMDPDNLDNFLEEAYSSDALSTVGMAVAGGLNAERILEDLPPLLAKYHDLSWDAEGQLHPLNNIGTRPLQMDIVRDYLRASVEILKKS
jgi:hypothetical protein